MTEVPGGIYGVFGVVLATIALARFLLGDNKVAATHTEQITALTKTVTRLEAKVKQMEDENVFQRSLKHDMRQDLTKATFPLSMIAEAEDFETVQMLQPVIRSILADLQAKENHRRALEDNATLRRDVIAGYELPEEP